MGGITKIMKKNFRSEYYRGKNIFYFLDTDILPKGLSITPIYDFAINISGIYCLEDLLSPENIFPSKHFQKPEGYVVLGLYTKEDLYNAEHSGNRSMVIKW